MMAETSGTEVGERALLLGKSWFPGEVGGLDRFFRDLFLQFPPGARAVVVGPAPAAPPSVHVASPHDAPILRRLVTFTRLALRAGRDAAVVDAHFPLYAFAPLLLPPLRSKPLVVHFQGPWAAESTLAGDRSRGRVAVRRAVERVLYRRARRVIVLSSAFGRMLVEDYGVDPDRIRVEPPGVDTERFVPGERGEARRVLDLPDEGFVAVVVRRLVQRMGIETLLEAWSRALPDVGPATLVVAGDGPHAPVLRARAAELGLEESVRFLGVVSDEAVVGLYQAADVNVVPTLALEGYGLIVLEAAACGTPSVVTDVGGLPEAVAGLDASLVVPPADDRTLARRLVGAAAGELPPRDACRRYAERFTWAAVYERTVAVYREAASEPPPRARRGPRR